MRQRLGTLAAGVTLGFAILAAPPLLSLAAPGLVHGSGVAAAAAPSVNDVEAAIARGDMDGAHRLLQQVISANPNSARARYLDAQVLEHSHRYGEALAEMQSARQIDPSIGFTDKSKFEAVERRITTEAGGRSGGGSARIGSSDNNAATTTNGSVMQSGATVAHHGPGIGLWIALLVVIVLVVLVVRWAMRKRQSEDEAGETDLHRDALRQATALQQTLRAIKLDLKLSTSTEKDNWLRDADAAEGELRTLIDELTNANDGAQRYSSPEASPPYRLEDLTRRVDRLKAVSEGRPDPFLQSAAAGQRSPYADEAERLAGGNQPYGNQPYANQPPQQQPTVIVQQPQQSGFGSGLGGLAAGVMLGELLGGHRDSQQVIVEHDRSAPAPDQGGNNNPNQDPAFDFGNGGDNWGGGSGNTDNFDMADNSDNSWDDNNS
jgi:hypothetical protein